MAEQSTDLLKTYSRYQSGFHLEPEKRGPVFWYAASVPGPFYVYTELVIGPALAEKLLAARSRI